MNDYISRQAAINEVDSETINTNLKHFKSSEKFIKFMDDADIASFGKWQWANGFNTALIASKIRLEELPSAKTEIIHCKDCRWWDKYSDYDIGYCMAAKHGYWTSHWDISIRRKYEGDFYCADAEMRGEWDENR